MLRTSSASLRSVLAPHRFSLWNPAASSSKQRLRGLFYQQNNNAAVTLFYTTSSSSVSPSNSETSKSIDNNNTCPFTGRATVGQERKRDIHSSATNSKAADAVLDGSAPEVAQTTTTPLLPLNEVPAVPIFGSFLHAVPLVGKYLSQYYDVPVRNKNGGYKYSTAMREKYGDFYALTIPGMGKIHFMNDPVEMMKVLRQEGTYPRGGIEHLRPLARWGKSRGISFVSGEDASGEDNGFLGRGETWRRLRTFLQTDMLSPKSARRYVPGVVRAAEIASKGAPHHADNMNQYLNYCAFDMFNTIMLGEITNISNPNSPSDPVNNEFVKNSVNSLALLIGQVRDPLEIFQAKMGIETPKYKEYSAAMDVVNRIAKMKISAFQNKWENGELDTFQKLSYFASAFERQKESSDKVSIKELKEISMVLLNTGVDTTSNFMCWALVHLALDSNVQDKLYFELKENVKKYGSGRLSAEAIKRSNSPYLHAVLRESHRITPVHPNVLTKSSPNNDIQIHGHVLPKGSIFSFDSYSLGMDPDVIDSPTSFIPERWTSSDEIDKRKGTRAEVLNHQFFKDPFSQGARRCPGSRIAVNETLVMLSQLVLDWKFEFAPETNINCLEDVPYEQQTFLLPIIPKMTLTPRS